MDDERIDRWTQLITRTALQELAAAWGRGTCDPGLFGGVFQRVREVLTTEPRTGSLTSASRSDLARELALTVYLTTAVDSSPETLSPRLLGPLSRSIDRTLAALGREGRQRNLRGGAQMKRILTLTAVLTAVSLAVPQGAYAVPEFAKQWNSSCASCHVGAPTSLDEEGVAFRLAGYENGVEPEKPRPALFFSFLVDLVSLSGEGGDDDMEAPETAQLFSLFRLDNAGKAKIFAIGELNDDPVDGLNLDFAHGHIQFNPLEKRERLNLRVGNIEPMTRMWNTDMRRVFESPLWGGVDVATGEVTQLSGGHAHGHAGSGAGAPPVLPASDWGGDASSVIGRNLLVSGGGVGDELYGGVFLKRGGRGFDNSTYASGLDYASMSEDQQAAFNQQQTKMAKKWERSVIFGLSAYIGNGNSDVFDGSFLSHGDEHAEDEHGDEEHGDEGHGDEGEGEEGHGDEGHGEEGHDEEGHDEEGQGEEGHGDEHVEAFLPGQISATSRIVGEIKTRWDRWGTYFVAVYGSNDYELGDGEEWEHEGVFVPVTEQSNDFFAWAVEGSTRLGIDPTRTARLAVRYEELRPEADAAERFQRAVANLTIPIRIMRPALWPYAEAARDITHSDWNVRAGLRIAY